MQQKQTPIRSIPLRLPRTNLIKSHAFSKSNVHTDCTASTSASASADSSNGHRDKGVSSSSKDGNDSGEFSNHTFNVDLEKGRESEKQETWLERIEDFTVVKGLRKGWKKFASGLRAPPLPDSLTGSLSMRPHSPGSAPFASSSDVGHRTHVPSHSTHPIVLNLPEVEEESVDEIVVDNALHHPTNGLDKGEAIESNEHSSGFFDDEEEMIGDEEEGGSRSKHKGLKNCVRNSVTWKFLWGDRLPCSKREMVFQVELWQSKKKMTFFATLFQIVIWVLALGLMPRPWTKVENIIHPIVMPIFLFLLPVYAYFDFPIKRWWIWQITLFIQTWLWASANIYDMYTCGYFDGTCGTKDFLSTFFYGLQAPVLAIFVMGQARFFHVLGTSYWIILIGVLILPERIKWIRHLINFLIFNIFLILLSYFDEINMRRTFTLRDQLKSQHLALEKARIRERTLADSTKRFFNYLFHEIRVPLNTGLLAIQNMQAAGVFDSVKDKSSEHHDEYTALETSLLMVQNVLNDVLDFNRMEAGRFSTVYKPFSFRKVMQSLSGGARVQCLAKKLDLIEEFDPKIEEVARIGGCLLKNHQDLEGCSTKEPLLCGDQVRLRQIITNLVSNAIKFTPEGGRVKIVTKLLTPFPLNPPEQFPPSKSYSNVFSHEERCEPNPNPRHPSNIAVRIEVHDTGSGIRQKDLKNNRLFSPYVQTPQGMEQGGKGTGLGLALIRSIVQHSGGRLGVHSKVGEGSCFWVELSLGLVECESGLPSATFSSYVEKEKGFSNDGSYVQVETVKNRDPSSTLDGQKSESLVSRAPDSNPMIAAGSGSLSTLLDKPLPLASNSQERLTVPITEEPLPMSSQVPIDYALKTQPMSLIDPTTPPPPTPRTQSDGHDESPRKLKCLIVEDDPVTRRLMARMVKRVAGESADQAENGQVALDVCLGTSTRPPKHYDVIFMDNQMPIVDGTVVSTKLKEAGRKDWIVGVTGNALREDQEDYLKKGADEVLIKPVMETQLVNSINNLRNRKLNPG